MYVLRVSEGKIYIYIYTSEKSVQLGVQKRNSVQKRVSSHRECKKTEIDIIQEGFKIVGSI